jgi:hypothetical protein
VLWFFEYKFIGRKKKRWRFFGRAPAGAEKIERVKTKKCNTAGLSVCLFDEEDPPFFFLLFLVETNGFFRERGLCRFRAGIGGMGLGFR